MRAHLLDQNLSPKLVPKLNDVLPGLESVYDHNLLGASDPMLFAWAREREIAALMTADRDFVHLVHRVGPPPKIVRIERCDVPSKMIEQLIRREAIRIHEFFASERSVLILKTQSY